MLNNVKVTFVTFLVYIFNYRVIKHKFLSINIKIINKKPYDFKKSLIKEMILHRIFMLLLSNSNLII